ncbi:MBL fold metallo-hydrolase [uncultured Pseudokineococcus sp.]|uniref:MBL fold metallo-hydrolase n=1 Tax=uncultured Pseudokineococcus sp. TaxID=1642928 RepID=UPI002633B8A5|nr:MBL fold metallo-hydrolase [uncultured Pseudokineococcus sp.]
MPARELVVLGTSSAVPTRTRNHSGHLLRWDGAGLLVDPGEGTQRQMLLAGVSASDVDVVALTHEHGDHVLGLPGVLQRRALDGLTTPVPLVVPAAAAPLVGHLLGAAAHAGSLALPCPVEGDGPVRGPDGDPLVVGGAVLHAVALDHRVPACAYRLVEPDGRRMLRERLTARGVRGPDVGVLQREGRLRTAYGVVALEEVSEHRPGQVVAVVEDTRWCEGALRAAGGADLLVCEATFADAEEELAGPYGHLTARQAGRIARESGARRLVLTHFSSRYPDVSPLLAQAREEHDDVVAAVDLERVAVPSRR